jgi:phosphoribosylamine--glycine ligase
MSRLLLIDQDCVGLDFALRCAAAGHEVKWARWSKTPIRDGEGFPEITRVEDWRPHMPWAKSGIVVCTSNHRFLTELDRFRDFGFRIFAPTAASARLEIERQAGMEAMQAAGLSVPPYQLFDSLADAEAFARKSDTVWVAKPAGDEADKSLTYCSRDAADLVGWLQRKQKSRKKPHGKIMLQQKVELMSELGVSGWFGPEGFLPDKWQIAIEHKQLMNGDIGPNTGEQGTITQYCETDKMADECLKPLEATLRALGHRGDTCIGAGIGTDGKIYPFEWTLRLGWPSFFIQVASHRGDPLAWMIDLMDGKDSLRVSQDVAIGVVMAQPNYPYSLSPPELVVGNPIEGLDDVWPDVHLASVMRSKGPVMKDSKVVEGQTYETSGEYVLCATALGKSVTDARKKVYRTIDKIHFPNRMFRTDIGEKVQAALPDLHRRGFALEMESE